MTVTSLVLLSFSDITYGLVLIIYWHVHCDGKRCCLLTRICNLRTNTFRERISMEKKVIKMSENEVTYVGLHFVLTPILQFLVLTISCPA